SLDCFPSRVLRLTKLFFFPGMPADCCRIKYNFRATQSSQSGRFRIPLVPTNTDTDFAMSSLPGLKSQIARGKIKFFVIERIIRDVHLSILTQKFSIGVDDRGCVVINAGTAFLEEGRNDDDPKFA